MWFRFKNLPAVAQLVGGLRSKRFWIQAPLVTGGARPPSEHGTLSKALNLQLPTHCRALTTPKILKKQKKAFKNVNIFLFYICFCRI